MSHSSIAVITDNPHLLNEFLKEAALHANSATFAYFTTGGCKELEEIQVKEYQDTLIESFDLVISLNCRQLFPSKLVNGVTCVNFHPGLNPYNRGMYPQVFSILKNEPTGATLHIIDDKIDHGPIIDQIKVPIHPDDNSATVFSRIVEAEVELIRRNVRDLVYKTFKTSPVNETGTLNTRRDFEALCQIDLDKKYTGKEWLDYLRAFTHPPYRNLYFVSEDGTKFYVSIDIKK